MKPQFTPVAAEANGVFLGTVIIAREEHNPKMYDLYYIPIDAHMGVEPTLSARYNNEPADYMSGLPFGWDPDSPNSPLVIARILAEARGLDCRREYYAGKMKNHDGILVRYEADPVPLYQQDDGTPTTDPGTTDKPNERIPAARERAVDDWSAERCLNWAQEHGVRLTNNPEDEANLDALRLQVQHAMNKNYALHRTYSPAVARGPTANPADEQPDTENPPPHNVDFGA